MLSTKKTEFEFLFPIISGHKKNIFEHKDDYFNLRTRYELTKDLFKKLPIDEVYIVDYYANRFSEIPTKHKETLYHDAVWLLNYLKSGKTIIGKHPSLEHLLSSSQLRKRLYIAQTIHFEQKTCRTPNALELLIKHCEVHLQLEAIGTLFDVNTITFDSQVKKYQFLKKINTYTKETLIAYEKGILALEHLKVKYDLS